MLNVENLNKETIYEIAKILKSSTDKVGPNICIEDGKPISCKIYDHEYDSYFYRCFKGKKCDLNNININTNNCNIKLLHWLFSEVKTKEQYNLTDEDELFIHYLCLFVDDGYIFRANLPESKDAYTGKFCLYYSKSKPEYIDKYGCWKVEKHKYLKKINNSYEVLSFISNNICYSIEELRNILTKLEEEKER